MHIILDATEIQRLEKTETYQHLITSRKCTRVYDEVALLDRRAESSVVIKGDILIDFNYFYGCL